MADQPLSSHKNLAERDLTWGADCEGCEERMNAGRARLAAEYAGDGPLLCGSCRDEESLAECRDDARWLASLVYEFLLVGAGQRTGLNQVEMDRFLDTRRRLR